MGREDVEAAVVHVGQQLGRAGVDRGLPSAPRTVTRKVSRLPGPQPVAEGRELDLQLAVVPGHEDRRGLLHELVVADQRSG